MMRSPVRQKLDRENIDLLSTLPFDIIYVIYEHLDLCEITLLFTKPLSQRFITLHHDPVYSERLFCQVLQMGRFYASYALTLQKAMIIKHAASFLFPLSASYGEGEALMFRLVGGLRKDSIHMLLSAAPRLRLEMSKAKHLNGVLSIDEDDGIHEVKDYLLSSYRSYMYATGFKYILGLIILDQFDVLTMLISTGLVPQPRLEKILCELYLENDSVTYMFKPYVSDSM